jgi:hypothetical protein
VNRALGGAIAVVSGSGLPLTQLAIARLGRPGAAIVGVVTAAILAADIARLATRDPAVESRGARTVLYAETAIAAVATAANLALVTEHGLAAARMRGWQVGWVELVRRVSLGALFGIHATRFRSYLTAQARPGS